MAFKDIFNVKEVKPGVFITLFVACVAQFFFLYKGGLKNKASRVAAVALAVAGLLSALGFLVAYCDLVSNVTKWLISLIVVISIVVGAISMGAAMDSVALRLGCYSLGIFIAIATIIFAPILYRKFKAEDARIASMKKTGDDGNSSNDEELGDLTGQGIL